MSDDRPPIWIGHVNMKTAKFDASLAFMIDLGMRQVAKRENLAVLELRGGTHLILQDDAGGADQQASFDLMVDDIEAQHAALTGAGYSPTEIIRGKIHATFEVREPAGNTLKFFDSHAMGPV
jgi:catechol 2,3-dioxygenase-like lactoylglutathione lyase family enzyme